MKLVERARQALRSVGKARPGVYVSRPVLNGAEWNAWATKWGVPSPVPAVDLHVTVVHSAVDVRMIPQDEPMVVSTVDTWAPGCFCTMGPDDAALAFAFANYTLQDRFWAYQANGAVSTYPTYRPHLTLTYAVGAFELSDEALADAPEFIILGGEVNAPLAADDPTDADDGAEPDGDDDAADLTIIVLQASARTAARAVLDSESVAKTPIQRAALYDMVKGGTVTRRVAKSIAKQPWADEALKALAPAGAARAAALRAQPTKKSREVTLTLKQLPTAAVAKIGASKEVLKADDEQRLVWGIASVSTVDGELIEDSDGDKITTRALQEFTHDLVRNQRSGKFEHEGECCNEILEAIVMTSELQKALGHDYGMEFLLTVTHVPGDADWEKVKTGDWMHSIAGVMFYEEAV